MEFISFSMLIFIVLFSPKIWKVFRILLWRPYALTKSFEKLGIVGPSYKFLSGSLHEIKRLNKGVAKMVLDTSSNDIIERVVPHYHKWFSDYGETFLYWYGTQPRICISDPELVKQILSNKFGFYIKPRFRPCAEALIGRGLSLVSGLDWVRHRRIVNPAFSMDKLKVMTKRVAICTISMFEEWKNQVITSKDQCIKIKMNVEFQKLTADIIAHTAFGSSYVHGMEAFETQRELQKCCVASSTDIFIPGSQYLPTPSNLQIWKLDKKVKNSIRCIVESRLNSQDSSSNSGYGNDLLGLMIAASQTEDGPKLNMDEIIEECKTFFFAGHETTSNFLTWTTMLLSSHQDWQAILREEVLKECGIEIPDADMLAKLKLVNMVLLEVLRLYCPIIMLVREASKDMKLGDLMIPKRTCITIPIVKIHRSKEYWGEDGNEFNPLRFINGVSKAAKHPNALLPFAMGPRACIGQNFAMLETKTVLALMLQRFCFSLSPEYKHAPANNLTLQPQYGLPIIVKPLH